MRQIVVLEAPPRRTRARGRTPPARLHLGLLPDEEEDTPASATPSTPPAPPQVEEEGEEAKQQDEVAEKAAAAAASPPSCFPRWREQLVLLQRFMLTSWALLKKPRLLALGRWPSRHRSSSSMATSKDFSRAALYITPSL